MVFFIAISLIILYARYVNLDIKKGKEFYKYYFPIFLIMFFLFAFQKGVGTDYNNYIKCATNNAYGNEMFSYYLRIKEYFFAFLLQIAYFFKYPQMIFILTSLIQNVLFGISLEKINKNRLSVTLFLVFYFILSLSFFNQFNVIRQFIAVQLLFLSYLLLLDDKKKLSIFLMLCAPFFHKSSVIIIILMLVLAFFNYKNIEILKNKRNFFILSLLLLLIYFIDINTIIFYITNKLHFYSSYIVNGYTSKMSLVEISTKIAKLIVVYYCIYKLNVSKLSIQEEKLYKIGCLSALIMILSFSSTLIWRIYLYFDLFIIFPVLLFFKYNKNSNEKKIIFTYLLLFLILKIIIMPQGEYLYHSIFGLF